MESAWSASGSLREEPPAGSRDKAPGGGQRAKPPEAESFSSIFIQKGPKVKYLNKRNPLFFGPLGGGAPGPPIPGSASALYHFNHSWLHQ